MNKIILSALILLTTGFSHLLYADEANIRVEDAWISEAPPVSKVMVAYLTINNDSDEKLTITKAESDMYSRIEFHETVHENGMARMISYETLIIPAHGHMRLERGGAHFMLFNPKRPLKDGDTVNITLSTDKNATKTVSVPVRKAQY